MSAYAPPILVSEFGETRQLERITFGSLSDGSFDEAWLQKALYEFPVCLPVKEIDPSLGVLIPLCTEIETGAGPADILFATETGRLVLVETKLWRNPESRREVVGQILDYAKQLSSWTYEDIDQAVRAARSDPKTGIAEVVAAQSSAFDESAFVDAVNHCLKNGNFLLLIVGDGIRQGAEALVAFLERFSNLRFHLALVEVAAYKLPNGGRLLQPRILAKTEIIERTILIGPTGPLTYQQAAQVEDSVAPSSAQRDWFMSFWAAFIPRLKLNKSELLPREPSKSTNLFFPMPPGGRLAWISTYIAQSTNRAGVYLTFSKAFERVAETCQELLADRQAIEAEVGFPLVWDVGGDKVYISAQTLEIGDLNNLEEREKLYLKLADSTSRLVNVLEPRLAALAQSSSRDDFRQ